jgi:cytochrome c
MRAVCMIPVLAALGAAACGEQAPSSAAPRVAAPAPADLPAPYRDADLVSGQALFGKKCGACHLLDPEKGHRVGPNLHAMFDRGVAALADYGYSPALIAFDAPAWTPELVDQWLRSPDDFVPGTSMRLNGITEASERRDLIAHLLIASRQ